MTNSYKGGHYDWDDLSYDKPSLESAVPIISTLVKKEEVSDRVPIFISHRGNLDGPNPELENRPEYIQKALDLGYEVEVDVWLCEVYDQWNLHNILFLGHDRPQYPCPSSFLHNNKIWMHCKNLEAIEYLCQNSVDKAFWHQSDQFTIPTPGTYVWTYPGEKLGTYSICVLPELNDLRYEEIKHCAGICSDYIQKYKESSNV